MTHDGQLHVGDWPVLLVSIVAGMWSWVSDPVFWKAALLALAFGFLGGIGRAVGHRSYMWWMARRRQRKANAK